jgi:hypothetical protein
LKRKPGPEHPAFFIFAHGDEQADEPPGCKLPGSFCTLFLGDKTRAKRNIPAAKQNSLRRQVPMQFYFVSNLNINFFPKKQVIF